MRGIDPGTRDWRCGMLARALVARGHSVLWWSSTFNHYSKTQRYNEPRTLEIMPDFKVRLLHGPGYRHNKSLKRWQHHRVVAREFAKEALAASPPDIIFASLPTLELAEQAVRYGKSRQLPVLVDVRDLWPDHYLTLAPGPLRPIFKAALWPEYKRVGRILNNATAITAISPSYLNWALRHAGRSRSAQDGIFFMGYPISFASTAELASCQKELLARFNLKPTDQLLTFVGAFISSYALPTAIAAARLLGHAAAANFRLVLVGDGTDKKKLHALARGLDNVIFVGWCDQTTITTMLKMSMAALAPYRNDASMSLPNKPFEYMAAGLPLISSLHGDLEELVRKEGIGLQYNADDPHSLLEQIRWLTDHPLERQTMGRRAKELFEKRFREDIVYNGLIDHLEQVAAGPSRR